MNNTITSVAPKWASSSRKRKNHQRIFTTTTTPAPGQGKEGWQVSFDQSDEIAVEAEEDDPIVISADIRNNTVRRILIDDGSAVKILSYDVYQKMGLRDQDLKPAKPIYGFGNNSIHVRGGVTLLVTIRQGAHTLTFFANFVMVDQPMAYNAIFGRPMMKATQMVTAVYCLTVKFPTPTGFNFVRADLEKARECEVRAIELTQKTPNPSAVMEIKSNGAS